MLAMDVNDNARFLAEHATLKFIASKLNQTETSPLHNDPRQTFPGLLG